MKILKSAMIGMLSTFAAGLITLALSQFVDVFSVFVAPARLLLPLIGPLIPDKLVYWLVPNGGAPAGVLLVVSCTLLVWTVLLGAGHFVWAEFKQRQHR